MDIANIFPVANQEFYKDEKVTMILAHIVQKGLYKKENFSNDQLIILDNGLFEKAQVSTDLQDCIDLAEQSGIPVTEIVVPDAINDLDATIRLFEQNLETMYKYADKYSFMFVAQARTYGELHKAIQHANHYLNTGLNITVGISKLTPLDRANELAVRCYRESVWPIHFLGLKDSFRELAPVASIIRSCDTSQLAFIDKNTCYQDFCWEGPYAVLCYARSMVHRAEEIDLINDICSAEGLHKLREALKKEGTYNGIL